MSTSPEAERVLEVEDLECYPKDGAPLRGVTLEVFKGDSVVVVGPNGGGKSTLCRCLALLERPAHGSVKFLGERLAGGPDRAVRLGLVVLLKGRRVFQELSVRENLAVVADARRGRSAASRLDGVLEMFPALAGRQAQLAGTLSGGEQQMLALARAFLFEPKMLVLGEPSLGLSPRAGEEVYVAIEEYRARGGTVLRTEEDLRHAQGSSARAYLVVRGKVVAEGSPAELQKLPEAQEAHL